VGNLKHKIVQFVDHNNQHRKPFRSTATSDSILQKLARISKANSGTARV